MPQGKPNILFIMSDDHSANAVSCYGSLLSQVFCTPNIDRIANGGIRLSNFFSTNAICTPARATILTGQYGHINGVRTLADSLAYGYRPNLAVLLNENGYQTALVGKWHLHVEPEGFDDYRYLSGVGGQGTYRDPEFTEKNRGVSTHQGYVTDIITDMSLDWLEKRDKSRPYMLLCHHKAPHDFWEYPERHEKLFDGIDIPVPDSFFEDKGHRSEASREYGSSVSPRSKIRSLYEDFCKPDYVTGPLLGTDMLSFQDKGLLAYKKYLEDYLRTVAGIDDSVGRLLDGLEADGSLDDTIVIYTSDQGMFLGEHDYQDKRWSFEEGLRSPFLIRYPKEIEQGIVREEMVTNTDIARTLLDYAGVDAPDEMQGFSFRGMLAGKSGQIQDSIYFRYWMHLAHGHHNPAHYGIRTPRWKLIYFYGLPLDASGASAEESPAGWELYDVRNDPYELRNLYKEPSYAEIVQSLKKRLAIKKNEVKDLDDRYPELIKRLDESE